MADTIKLSDVSTEDDSELKTGGRRKYNMPKECVSKLIAKGVSPKEAHSRCYPKAKGESAKQDSSKYSKKKKGETILEWQFREGKKKMIPKKKKPGYA